MKALTLKQPWASLIVSGAKPTEHRSWPTRYRGPLLIHAGAKLLRDEPHDMPAPLPQSAIVGIVELVDCTGVEKDWQWHLSAPVAFPEPIPCPGRLGLWAPSPEILAALPADVAASPPVGAVAVATAKGRDPGWHCHCVHCRFKEVPVAAGAQKALCPRCGKWSQLEE